MTATTRTPAERIAAVAAFQARTDPFAAVALVEDLARRYDVDLEEAANAYEAESLLIENAVRARRSRR